MEKSNPATVLDSWSSISEKTVFVLDRSPYFTSLSSGHSINGDCLKDSKKTAHLYANQPSIKPFDRSLWTCTVEAVVGYSRLVWDLFTPDQRCISIVSVAPNSNPVHRASDPVVIERVCGWNDEEQNLEHLMKSLAKMSHTHQIYPPQKLGVSQDISSYPNSNSDSIAILDALDRAIAELGHLTSAQVSRKATGSSSSSTSAGANNGRIILISSFQSGDAVAKLIDKFEAMLARKNDSLKEELGDSSTSANMSCINYCDLVIVNTFPIMDEGPCSKISSSNSFRPSLHSKVYSVKSGRIIAGLLNNLCLQHHNLRSTTITGIPMKEEQNASSSSQYDVEIVHCSSIHEDVMASGSPLLEGVVEVIDRNGFPCDTFKLSWCTPRSSTIELNHCVATSRITAVDVNSRPSACLTNFLLNGRAVMLEIFKSKSNRMTTHILASHNGELYIHSLATLQPKQNVGDPPSISDQLGGKVGDYRQNDFINFMKQHAIVRTHMIDKPLSRSCGIVKRQTLYWPLTLGHTILLNVPNLTGKLISLIPKESLSQTDVDECKRTIDELIKHEKNGQALPSVSIAELMRTASTKSGGPKLDQLYKLLWNELEYFLRIHSTSPEHEAVLEHLSERNEDKQSETSRGAKRAASSKLATSQQKRVKTTSQLIPEISDSSTSIQQSAKYYKTGMTLWSTWTQLYHQYHRSRGKLPFAGRTQLVTLYSNVNNNPAEASCDVK